MTAKTNMILQVALLCVLSSLSASVVAEETLGEQPSLPPLPEPKPFKDEVFLQQVVTQTRFDKFQELYLDEKKGMLLREQIAKVSVQALQNALHSATLCDTSEEGFALIAATDHFLDAGLDFALGREWTPGLDAAITETNKALAIHPFFGPTLSLKAALLDLKGAWEEAEQLHLDAQECTPPYIYLNGMLPLACNTFNRKGRTTLYTKAGAPFVVYLDCDILYQLYATGKENKSLTTQVRVWKGSYKILRVADGKEEPLDTFDSKSLYPAFFFVDEKKDTLFFRVGMEERIIDLKTGAITHTTTPVPKELQEGKLLNPDDPWRPIFDLTRDGEPISPGQRTVRTALETLKPDNADKTTLEWLKSPIPALREQAFRMRLQLSLPLQAEQLQVLQKDPSPLMRRLAVGYELHGKKQTLDALLAVSEDPTLPYSARQISREIISRLPVPATEENRLIDSDVRLLIGRDIGALEAGEMQRHLAGLVRNTSGLLLPHLDREQVNEVRTLWRTWWQENRLRPRGQWTPLPRAEKSIKKIVSQLEKKVDVKEKEMDWEQLNGLGAESVPFLMARYTTFGKERPQIQQILMRLAELGDTALPTSLTRLLNSGDQERVELALTLAFRYDAMRPLPKELSLQLLTLIDEKETYNEIAIPYLAGAWMRDPTEDNKKRLERAALRLESKGLSGENLWLLSFFIRCHIPQPQLPDNKKQAPWSRLLSEAVLSQHQFSEGAFEAYRLLLQNNEAPADALDTLEAAMQKGYRPALIYLTMGALSPKTPDGERAHKKLLAAQDDPTNDIFVRLAAARALLAQEEPKAIDTVTTLFEVIETKKAGRDLPLLQEAVTLLEILCGQPIDYDPFALPQMRQEQRTAILRYIRENRAVLQKMLQDPNRKIYFLNVPATYGNIRHQILPQE